METWANLVQQFGMSVTALIACALFAGVVWRRATKKEDEAETKLETVRDKNDADKQSLILSQQTTIKDMGTQMVTAINNNTAAMYKLETAVERLENAK